MLKLTMSPPAADKSCWTEPPSSAVALGFDGLPHFLGRIAADLPRRKPYPAWFARLRQPKTAS